MAEMRIALAAEHFGACHTVAVIGFSGNVLFGNGSPKAWPTGSRFELCIGAEQGVAAANATIHAFVVQLVILASEGRLGALFAGDRKLLGSELALPLFVAFDYFFSGHNSQSLSGVREVHQPDQAGFVRFGRCAPMRAARQKGATPAQVALAWLLAQKPWIVPIPGSRKLERLDDNIGSTAVELTSNDLSEIKEAMSQITVIGDRY